MAPNPPTSTAPPGVPPGVLNRPGNGDRTDSAAPTNDRLVDRIGANVLMATQGALFGPIAMSVGAVILVIGAFAVWTSFTASATPSNPETPTSLAHLQATPRLVIVHVSGRVVAPGIVEVPASARIFHAVQAAGGTLPDANTDAINLAALVTDGSQVYVPALGTGLGAEDPDTAAGVGDQVGIVEAAPRDISAAPPTATTEVIPNSEPSTNLPPTTETPTIQTATTDARPATQTPPTTDAPTTTQTATTTDALPAYIQDRLFDREIAPTPEEVNALLQAEGLGVPAELAALLASDTPPTPEELESLLEQIATDD